MKRIQYSPVHENNYPVANTVGSAWFAVVALQSIPYAVTTLVICMRHDKAAASFHIRDWC